MIVMLPLFLLAPLFAQEESASEEKELASVAILPYEDKTGTKNFGYLPGSLVDAIDSSMRQDFTYRRIVPETVTKALEAYENIDKSSAKAISLISNELEADIIIFGSFIYNESDKNVTIYTNIYFPTIGEVSNLEPVTNPVDSTLFQVTDKVAKQIIDEINTILAAHRKETQAQQQEGPTGKQEVTVAALEKHGQHWSLGLELQMLLPSINLDNGPQGAFVLIPVEKKLGSFVSLYNSSGVGYFESTQDASPYMAIRFPVSIALSLPLYLFFPDTLLPLVDGAMFNFNLLNGGSINPYVGIPVHLFFDPDGTFGDILVEAGVKIKFNLNSNNSFFINGGVSYSLVDLAEEHTSSIYSNHGISWSYLQLSFGWSYLFR